MKEIKFNIGDLAIGVYNRRFFLWEVKQVITTTRQSKNSTKTKSEYLCQMVTDGEVTMDNTFDETELYTKEEFTELYNKILANYEKEENKLNLEQV